MLDHFISIMVNCPVCNPPDEPMVWPFSLETLPPEVPEVERDEFGPITSKTRRILQYEGVLS